MGLFTRLVERNRQINYSRDAISGLSPELQDIAKMLASGSRDLYHEFRRAGRLMSVRQKAQPGIFLDPPIGFRLLDVGTATIMAVRAATRSVRASVRNYESLASKPNLQRGQLPRNAAVVCSDSRLNPHVLLDGGAGEAFIFRNVGASLESAKNPSVLSEGGQAFIAYARHLGTPALVIFTHGMCGCIANAHDLVGGAKDVASTTEGQVFKQMAQRKAHLLRALERYGADSILGLLDYSPVLKDQREKNLLAMEVLHGLHNYKLARNFVRRLAKGTEEKPMKVYLAHKDLRTLDMYLYDPAQKKMVRLTDHPTLPDCYYEKPVAPVVPRNGRVRPRREPLKIAA